MQIKNVAGGATTKATVSELSSSTNYSLEVAAVTNAGIGAYSSPITKLTLGTCTLSFLFIGLG